MSTGLLTAADLRRLAGERVETAERCPVCGGLHCPGWEAIPGEGLHLRPARLVPCDDLGSPGDVDEPGDLPERFRGSSS